MKFRMKRAASSLAWSLCVCLALQVCALKIVAQNRPAEQPHRRAIIVNAEQPNVWTLEQAHYLLAQMHRRSLDLKATGLGELNPNEINGLNFDVLRTLVEFGVAFDDAARFNNSLLKRDKRFDADRAIRLQSRRDQLADESLVLTRDIARMQREKALAETQEEKDSLTAAIAEQTSVRDGLDKEVTRLDNDLKTAGGPTGEVQATGPPASADPNRLPKSTFDEAFKGVTKDLIDRFNQAPQLNATLRLDNFLQMQYEIIAKQLTLLRDEVGPGQRIIFLEMPQTVNTAYDKANNKWAQSWWRIVGYTSTKDEGATPVERMSEERSGADKVQERQQRTIKTKEEAIIKTSDVIKQALTVIGGGKSDRVEFHNLDLNLAASNYPGGIKPEDASVRTIELIPRQSSLNVNDIKLRARSGVLTAVAKTLFGFGAQLNVQRQRETFSQFVQQELYSSGFGKGSREFGWTFTPMPGTDRVMSGTKTTYAVMVVPEDAETLLLHSTGCYFPRSEYQPNNFANTAADRWTDSDRQSRNCSAPQAFIVPIPGGGSKEANDFFVDGLEYEPAEKGGRVVLSIYGRNFSTQTGVMVDGVPLPQAIGLAQPLIRDDSMTGERVNQDLKDAKVRGRTELIDSEQMVAVFERLDGKEETPVITITAPGKAKNLNALQLYINGKRKITLADAAPMFGKRPPQKPKPDFRIDKVEVFRSRTYGNLIALISGAGFASGQLVLVNGSYPLTSVVESPTLLRAEFSVPADETIQVKLIAPNTADPAKTETIESDPVANPARLRVTNVSVVSYEAATQEEEATLVVKIEGSGFSDDLEAFINEKAIEIVVKSATEAILKITDPEPAVVVVLRDKRTGLETKTIVTRKTKPLQ